MKPIELTWTPNEYTCTGNKRIQNKFHEIKPRTGVNICVQNKVDIVQSNKNKMTDIIKCQLYNNKTSCVKLIRCMKQKIRENREEIASIQR